MPRWIRITRTTVVWAALALTVAGYFARPSLGDRYVGRHACGGALAGDALDGLTPAGRHLDDEASWQVDELGWYSCQVGLEGDRYDSFLLSAGAWTRRDDQDRRLLSAYGDRDTRMGALPGGLPGFVDDSGGIDLLLPCPDLGHDADGRPRGMLVSVSLRDDVDEQPSRAVYRAVAALAGEASDRLGCGARPLAVPRSAAVPTQSSLDEPKTVAPAETKGTGCSWLSRADLPGDRKWRVAVEANGAAPMERCDLSAPARADQDADKDDVWLGFGAWYGDWSDRLVYDEYSGERYPLTASAECAAGTANYALSASARRSAVDTATLDRLLKRFAEDQVHRHHCSGLRLTY